MFADKHSLPPGGNNMVFSSVKKFAQNGLSDLIRVLMENIDDALFGLSEKAESDRERNLYFEAMREIRIKRSLIQLSFDQGMEASFTQLIQNKNTNVIELDPGELTLVELDDLEDSIAIDNMISKARPNFEDDLFAVTERLKVVLQRNEIDEDINPFDPRAICHSFHNASDILETDIQVKLIFYKLFDKYVMCNLGHFYREMNDFFIQKGILPDFSASAERLKQTTKFLANRIKASSNQINPSSHKDITEVSAFPVAEGAITNSTSGPFAVLQQALSDGDNQPGISGGITGIPGAATGISGHAAIPYTNNSSGQGGNIAILPVAQNAAYMTALTSLQAANIDNQPVQSIDPQNFKQAMHQQLVSFSQENQHQTNASDNQIIDIVSMLFNFFLDDDTLPNPVKVLIGRLQIPILKAAIIDNNFFNQKKHPARQLLDSISKSSLGWSSDSAQEKLLIDKIESVVNYVLSEFEENIQIFESALVDFNDFLTEEAEKTRQSSNIVIEQELDEDRRINEAQDSATNLITGICKDHDLSFEVTDFLDTIWNSVLFHTCLSLGESSNHWNNLRRITTTLVWTLIPKFSEEERVKILKTLPALLRALSKGMELVKIGTDQQNRIFKILAQEHAKVVKQTTKNTVTRVDDKTIWPDEDHIADAFANQFKKDRQVIDVISAGELTEKTAETDVDLDSITEITLTETKEVIHNLEDFTACVNKGEIKVDEEIIMDSGGQAIFDTALTPESDDFLEHARALEIGTWVEFTEPDARHVNTCLSWKSNVTGKLVFVNRHGVKVKNMSVNAFAIELRSGRAKMIQSTSVFDRTINTIMGTIKH